MADVAQVEREIPLNLYRHGAPLIVRVLANRRLTPLDCANEVHHVTVQFPDGAFPFLEGQSAGMAPPGLNARGRAHVPRLYSIACDRDGEAGLANTLSLCVKRVVFKTESGNEAHGLASNMLCDAQPGDELPMTGPAGREFVLPDEPTANYLLIATGTGVAPFRGFAERRAKWPQEGRGKMWLFFGVQTHGDALYGDEWQAFAQDPDFRVTYAFSREEQTADGRRMYVQDRMREAGEELLAFVRGGNTHVYICGIKGMEVGIEEAFGALAQAAGVSWPELRQELRLAGRWHLEVY